MTEKKKKAIMNCETFDELLDQEYESRGRFSFYVANQIIGSSFSIV